MKAPYHKAKFFSQGQGVITVDTSEV